MAGGWTRDGAVLDQIDDTITDGVLTARARLPAGEVRITAWNAATKSPKRAGAPCRRANLRAMPVRPRRPLRHPRNKPQGQQG